MCLLLPIGAAAQEASTTRYDWLTAGEVSGSHLLQIREDGARVADFEFNDRGRGPKIHEEARFGGDGSLLSLQVSGHSYMGAPVQETFRVEDGRAAWESTLERGEAAAGGFYVAHDGTPEQQAVLARALLSAPGQRMDLLPAGNASIEAVATQEVEHEGQTRTHAVCGQRPRPDVPIPVAGRGARTVRAHLWLDGVDAKFLKTQRHRERRF